MPSVQLNFTLRTTPTVRSLHLVGSWDNYKTQLPMSLDASKKKSGAWAGTFKFQPGSLKAGSRYWYYYIMDGYHTTHDPARESVVEPTTQRKLNVLDIPASASSSSSSSSSRSSKRSSRRVSAEIPRGRAVSPSQIACPRPYRPGQTSSIANETYSKATLSELEARLARANIDSDSDDSDSDSDSDSGSDVPSLCSSRSGASSPASSLSYSSSASTCSCERYGITRAGNRVKLDCGGARCGGDDSDCSSESDREVYHARSTRRHGVVIRS